jgi:hypothetical protein
MSDLHELLDGKEIALEIDNRPYVPLQKYSVPSLPLERIFSLPCYLNGGRSILSLSSCNVVFAFLSRHTIFEVVIDNLGAGLSGLNPIELRSLKKSS